MSDGPTYALGSRFYARLEGSTLVLRRTADGTWAGETEVTASTAREMIRLAGAIDPATRQKGMFGEAAE